MLNWSRSKILSKSSKPNPHKPISIFPAQFPIQFIQFLRNTPQVQQTIKSKQEENPLSDIFFEKRRKNVKNILRKEFLLKCGKLYVKLFPKWNIKFHAKQFFYHL